MNDLFGQALQDYQNNNYTEEIKVTPVGSHYIKAVYDSDPEYVYPIEIATQPYVTRVDIPHSATSNKDGSFIFIRYVPHQILVNT